jgi:hypothetical protein
MNIQTTEICGFLGGVHLALPIGQVIAESNILYRFAYSSRHCLLIKLYQAEMERDF